jgi:Ca-activated chloride channel family protein
MRALDAELDGSSRTRLELARAAVSGFAERRVAEGDRTALVVFGSSAFTLCPLTSDGALLRAAVERVAVGVAGESTALGDALALAVKRAVAAPRDASVPPGAGRVVVLLTDGRSNAGSVPVDLAIDLARAEAIRVHTVGIGSAGESVPMAQPGAGRGLRFERHDVDPETLARVAARTGGRAFAARRSADLAAVYAEIDALERAPQRRPGRVRRAPHPEPLLAAAGGLLALEIALARVLRRRIP